MARGMDVASEDNFRKSAPVASKGTSIDTRGEDGEEVRDRYSLTDMVAVDCTQGIYIVAVNCTQDTHTVASKIS